MIKLSNLVNWQLCSPIPLIGFEVIGYRETHWEKLGKSFGKWYEDLVCFKFDGWGNKPFRLNPNIGNRIQ